MRYKSRLARQTNSRNGDWSFPRFKVLLSLYDSLARFYPRSYPLPPSSPFSASLFLFLTIFSPLLPRRVSRILRIFLIRNTLPSTHFLRASRQSRFPPGNASVPRLAAWTNITRTCTFTVNLRRNGEIVQSGDKT